MRPPWWCHCSLHRPPRAHSTRPDPAGPWPHCALGTRGSAAQGLVGGRSAGLEARAPRLSPLPRLNCPDQTTVVAPLHPARAPLPVPSQYPPSTRPGGSPASSWAGASAARTGASSACARRARPVRLGASFEHECCHPRSGCRVPSLLRSCALDARSTLHLRAFATVYCRAALRGRRQITNVRKYRRSARAPRCQLSVNYPLLPLERCGCGLSAARRC